LPRSPLSFEDFVGMYLNRDAVHFHRAEPVMRGILAASTDDDLDEAWFDGISDCEGESIRSEWQTNSERRSTRALSQVGRGTY
jgi:hypothetical protein